LERDKDKGERHNCCVAFEAVMSGEYRQVIFLTSELKATDLKRDGFLSSVFDTFPIGQIWSSLDFVLYLFLRHRRRFPFREAEDALRDINSRIKGRKEVVMQRLTDYNRKLKQIEQALLQLPAF